MFVTNALLLLPLAQISDVAEKLEQAEPLLNGANRYLRCVWPERACKAKRQRMVPAAAQELASDENNCPYLCVKLSVTLENQLVEVNKATSRTTNASKQDVF